MRHFAGVHHLWRDHIRVALEWLVQHHPAYQNGAVVLSEERLNLIPAIAAEGARNGTFADASRNEITRRKIRQMEAANQCVLIISDQPLPTSANEERRQEGLVQDNLDALVDLGPQPAALYIPHEGSGDHDEDASGEPSPHPLGELEYQKEGGHGQNENEFQQAVHALQHLVEGTSANGANALEPAEAKRKRDAAEQLIASLMAASTTEQRPGSTIDGPGMRTGSQNIHQVLCLEFFQPFPLTAMRAATSLRMSIVLNPSSWVKTAPERS